MINPKLFDMDRIVSLLLDTNSPNYPWRNNNCDIIKDGEKGYLVKYKALQRRLYLRWSKGPVQGYFWDVYGDYFYDMETALMALFQAENPAVDSAV